MGLSKAKWDSMRDGFKSKEETCPICGKLFIRYPEWVYKRGHVGKETYYCSWTCLRRAERVIMKRRGA